MMTRACTRLTELLLTPTRQLKVGLLLEDMLAVRATTDLGTLAWPLLLLRQQLVGSNKKFLCKLVADSKWKDSRKSGLRK